MPEPDFIMRREGEARGNSPRVADAVRALRGGGVVLLPTDTVYGLAVLPTDAAAVDRLFRLKKRPRARNLPIMVAGKAQVAALGVVMNDRLESLLDSPFVPGALSLVAGLDPARCPKWLVGRDEIAFRIPDSAFLIEVIGQTGPLLATSANLHGHATPTEAAGVVAQLDGTPDLVVEGPIASETPSTLVNCRYDPARIERIGAISPDDLSRYTAVCHE